MTTSSIVSASNLLKRSRVDDASFSPSDVSSWHKHPELYISDGSIVLLCEKTLFKVFGGILALNSEVFKDMLSLEPVQPTDGETYDGSPCVRLADRAKDFEVFLKALTIVGYFPIDGTLPPFHVVESVLQLSTKYRAHGLRDRLVHLLSPAYHTTLDSFLESSVDGEDIFTIEPPHPNRALNLFRECGLTQFLPFAFYRVCTSMSSIFNVGDGNRLGYDDLRIAAGGFTRLLQAGHNAICKMHESSPECMSPKCARNVMLRKEEAMSALLSGDPEAHFFEVTSGRDCTGWCNQCTSLTKGRWRSCRTKLWRELPSVFELPVWDALTNEM